MYWHHLREQLAKKQKHPAGAAALPTAEQLEAEFYQQLSDALAAVDCEFTPDELEALAWSLSQVPHELRQRYFDLIAKQTGYGRRVRASDGATEQEWQRIAPRHASAVEDDRRQHGVDTQALSDLERVKEAVPVKTYQERKTALSANIARIEAAGVV